MKTNRLISLDVFRGMTIVGMILVNNPGSWSYVYPPLRHAAWNGWTPTDLIFPFFLFIMGVAMALSLQKRKQRGDTFALLYKKIIYRTVMIFLLGMLLHLWWRFDFTTVRLPGVLQRIAICYFFTAVIVLHLKPVTQYIVAGVLLIGYWLLLTKVPVPGYGAGVLEPVGNLCWFVDSHLFAGHTWSGAPAPGFDPEGLLSTIPAVVSTMLGVFTGNWLRNERDHFEKVAGMFVAGSVAIVLGLMWHPFFPINKNLWTGSYVIFTAGMALQFLAFCYWLIDIHGFQSWGYFFRVFGSNAIVAYVSLGLVGKTLYLISWQTGGGETVTLKSFLFEHLFHSWAGDYLASLLFPITMIIIWYIGLWWMYRRKIFIRI